MKVYINRQPRLGPWGGGAKTVNKLAEGLLAAGHTVVYQLQDKIDVIFCFDPRPNSFMEGINHLYAYRQAFPKTKIVQRVGDVGTHSKPDLTKLVKHCIPRSDHFIFPSEWSMNYIEYSGGNHSVIHNSPMKEFYKNRNENLKANPVPKIVTHHWSTNPKKGFDLYEKFEEYCYDTGDFSFHYIGQTPPGIKFKRHTPPVDTNALVDLLPNHDIYLTASEEEAGANHVLEGMACGLPVVYRGSGGSIPEYCGDRGVCYNNFLELLESVRHIRDNYSKYKKACLQYKDTNDEVIEQYIEIIRRVHNEG